MTSTKTASEAITEQIRSTEGWRGRRLAELRALILRADPEVIEEVKWRKPSNPDGVPVWSHNGILCIGNTLKNAVRLTFPQGARIKDPRKLFNTRLDSKTVRALDSLEGDRVDGTALEAIIREAIRLNTAIRPGRLASHRSGLSKPSSRRGTAKTDD